jgi:hypothetical protein
VWLKDEKDFNHKHSRANMSEAYEQISIPKSIYAELIEEVEISDFDNVDEYATYVFEELTYYLDGSDTDVDIADQDQLKERLESLGYIEDD